LPLCAPALLRRGRTPNIAPPAVTQILGATSIRTGSAIWVTRDRGAHHQESEARRWRDALPIDGFILFWLDGWILGFASACCRCFQEKASLWDRRAGRLLLTARYALPDA
jgi:hypothetical protein